MSVHLDRAIGLHQKSQLAEAERLYRQVLAAEPGNFTALHLLGLACHQQRRSTEGLAWIELALQADPASADAHANRGVMLEALGRPGDALESYDRAIALAPTPDSWNNRGNALLALKRTAQALASFDAAVAAAPAHAQAWNNRANALRILGRHDESLASFDRALALRPDLAIAWNNRSTTLRELKRPVEALASVERALALGANSPDAWNNRGAILFEMHRAPEAIASFERALALDSAHLDAWTNRGVALRSQARLEEALASFTKALAADPGHEGALYFRGFTCQDLNRPREALADFERLLERDPGHRYALGGIANAALSLCDWERVDTLGRQMQRDAKAVLPPLLVLGYSDDPAMQHRAAARALGEKLPRLPQPLWKGEVYVHDRLRIAYLSGDLHAHATAYLVAELFERHDRDAFEVIGVSYGPDDKSEMRARLLRGFDTFIDAAARSDEEVARLLRGMEVDVLIDLKGYTRDARPEILAFRPAPVQAHWLGYPGTMAAPFVDYVIADAMVLPRSQQPFYDEKIVHLPDSYQPNDSRRAIAAETPSRAEAGLPESGFVFCCFNGGWKIAAPVFDIWMRLLAQLPGSVLWLLEDNEAASANLKAEAAARGVDPARLVFARRVPLPAHLARHRLADLFLDTLPYNAHTTGSDALWAGLPLVTRRGAGFAARVGASLLAAAGLPELIADTAEEYESLALTLARDPALLKQYRDRLARGRLTAPLFDSARLARHLEKAYRRMTEIARRGAPAEAFDVARED